jgi:hypothetical protein
VCKGAAKILFEGWTEVWKDSDMSNLEKTFERYVAAERQLCDEAAPLLGAIIRGVEARLGVRISELRVTVDWANSVDGAIIANCTIVQGNETDHSSHSKPSDGAAESART